ncbi:ABC transporter permease [Cryobacterium melibiosiphilum]|uniref:ABC transporter permease n=1 Tax=Cryobacterium melibiosiphilum TaxID=995039 RepID=UPI0018F2819A|nr:ABC transporter permease subunit [Cryobacterium melibiosiphilum]
MSLASSLRPRERPAPPAPPTPPTPLPRLPRRRGLRGLPGRDTLGLLPYFAFITLFLLLPTVANVWTSLHDNTGGWSLASMRRLGEEQYVSAFLNTMALSAVTALLGGALGLVVAWALATLQRPRWLRSIMLSYSVVASQLGGIPLAFAFIAAMGSQGLITLAVYDATGWDLTETFAVSSFWGLVVVYLYFQVPLMAILVLPAIMGIRREWSDSALSLGAGRWRYLIDILLPILSPAIGGAVLLLFANSFSAYATAYALSGGGANLVPILIGFFISGNVLTDQSFGAALATGMMLVIAVAMVLRHLLVRRTTRWLQ